MSEDKWTLHLHKIESHQLREDLKNCRVQKGDMQWKQVRSHRSRWLQIKFSCISALTLSSKGIVPFSWHPAETGTPVMEPPSTVIVTLDPSILKLIFIILGTTLLADVLIHSLSLSALNLHTLSGSTSFPLSPFFTFPSLPLSVPFLPELISKLLLTRLKWYSLKLHLKLLPLPHYKPDLVYFQ